MPKKLPVAINEDEFTQLIKHTKRDDHKAGFLLGYGSGLRLSEIVGKEEDEKNKAIPAMIKENVKIEERKMLVECAKGEKDRIVPLPKGFKENMLNLMPLNRKYKNINSARRSFQRAFKIAAGKAGLLKIKPKLHFHSLRHGFGSRMAGQKVPIHHIRTLMGHANISTTNVYLEANPKDALKSYEDLF